jgi:hypothetical protein
MMSFHSLSFLNYEQGNKKMVPEHLTKWRLLELQMMKDREFSTHGVKIKHQMTVLGVPWHSSE